MESGIKSQIIKFINDYFIKDSSIVLKDETSFLDEGIIDSTGVMELVTFLETTYKIRIEDDEIIPDNFDSINRLVDLVQKKLGAQ